MSRFVSLPRVAALSLALSLLTGAVSAEPVFDAPANGFRGTVSARNENVVAGSTAEVTGRAFVPGQQVTLLRGETVLNATPYVVDAQGNFKASVVVPLDAVPGQHPLVVRESQPAAATVVALRVSPNLPLSGQQDFSQRSGKLVQG
ncbi:MAG: ATP-binding protein, partial [Stenotrophomonas sp.]